VTELYNYAVFTDCIVTELYNYAVFTDCIVTEFVAWNCYRATKPTRTHRRHK